MPLSIGSYHNWVTFGPLMYLFLAGAFELYFLEQKSRGQFFKQSFKVSRTIFFWTFSFSSSPNYFSPIFFRIETRKKILGNKNGTFSIELRTSEFRNGFLSIHRLPSQYLYKYRLIQIQYTCISFKSFPWHNNLICTSLSLEDSNGVTSSLR